MSCVSASDVNRSIAKHIGYSLLKVDPPRYPIDLLDIVRSGLLIVANLLSLVILSRTNNQHDGSIYMNCNN